MKKNGQVAFRLKCKAQNDKRSGSSADEKKQGKMRKITAQQSLPPPKSLFLKKLPLQSCPTKSRLIRPHPKRLEKEKRSDPFQFLHKGK